MSRHSSIASCVQAALRVVLSAINQLGASRTDAWRSLSRGVVVGINSNAIQQKNTNIYFVNMPNKVQLRTQSCASFVWAADPHRAAALGFSMTYSIFGTTRLVPCIVTVLKRVYSHSHPPIHRFVRYAM
jgi:hypothetical protein